MFKTKDEIKAWLKQYGISDYIINDDLVVDVGGNVYLQSKKLKEIPIQFGKIDGDFYCQNNYLISLKGCPHKVNGNFYCSNNCLVDLDFSPKFIQEKFDCGFNEITSIKNFSIDYVGIFYHDSISNSRFVTIKELESFYIKASNVMKRLNISGKELQSILSYYQLNETISQENTEFVKKRKI